MAKFQFRLQNILGVKEKLEEQKKMELSIASQLLETEESRLRQLNNLKEKNDCLYRSEVSNKIKIKDIKDIGEKNKYYSNIIIEQNIVVENANNKVTLIRNELRTALIERKMYEKLRESAYDEYYIEELKEEQKQLDEIVSYKYSR
jgi:flagellar FliJ protein